MNVKKSIVAITTSIVAFASLGSITSNAYSIINNNPASITASVATYEGRYSGTYSDFDAYVDHTTTEAKAGDLQYRYKYSYYAQYHKLTNGSWNLITQESKYNATPSVTTNSVPVTSNVDRRIHEGYTRQNASYTSPIIETYKVTVTNN